MNLPMVVNLQDYSSCSLGFVPCHALWAITSAYLLKNNENNILDSRSVHIVLKKMGEQLAQGNLRACFCELAV